MNMSFDTNFNCHHFKYHFRSSEKKSENSLNLPYAKAHFNENKILNFMMTKTERKILTNGRGQKL